MSNEMKKSLYGIPHFHDDFRNMEEVLEVVAPYLNTNGYFLVRWSFSKKRTLTITVTDKGMVKHFNVLLADGHLVIQDKNFCSIEDLCDFYRQHDVPNAEGHRNIRLLHPILDSGYASRSERLSSLSVGSFNFRSPWQSVERLSIRRSQTCTELNKKRRLPSTLPSSSSLFPRFQETGAKSRGRAPDADELGGHSRGREKTRKKSRSRVSGFESQPVEQPSASSMPSPLPTAPRKQHSESSESPYYSVVRRSDENILDAILEQLQKSEMQETCVCGLPLTETELCHGWSVHLSTEPATRGMVFFNSPYGETTWHLPNRIAAQLSPSQRDFIRLVKLGAQRGRKKAEASKC